MKNLSIIILGALLLAATAPVASCGEPPQATVISYAGEVEVIPAGAPAPVKCSEGMILRQGDKVITSADSYLEMAFDTGKYNVVKVNENTEAVIRFSGDDKIELIDGELITMLKGLKKGETFRIVTPCAVCGARGTGWATKTDGKETVVKVFDNRIFLKTVNKDGTLSKKEYWVKKGYERRVRKFERPERPVKMRTAEVSRLERAVRVKEPPRKKEKKPLIDARKRPRVLDSRNRIDEKKLVSLGNKIESRTDLAASRIWDRHVATSSPVKMNAIELRMHMQTDKEERKINRRDILDNRLPPDSGSDDTNTVTNKP